MTGPPFDTVLFDLDGTLVDSIGDIMRAVNRVLQDDGLPPVDTAQGRGLIGNGARGRILRAYSLHGVALSEDGIAARARAAQIYYEADLLASTRAFPGAGALLARLGDRGVRRAVCTNKSEAVARRILGGLGLGHLLDLICGADTFRARKPDPAAITCLLARLGAAPGGAVMVGDTVYDVQAAHGAGLKAIAVSWGYADTPPSALGADAVLDRFDDFESLAGTLR